MKGKIFNTEEVQSILNGSKVMFRVVVKPQPEYRNNYFYYGSTGYGESLFLKNAKFEVGETIFVKEAFAILKPVRTKSYLYRIFRCDAADFEIENYKWKPAQHMKQEHSRLFLQIKSIGVERLQDISEEDAIKEGISERNIEQDFPAVEYFKEEWNSTHKKPEEKWEANPFVFCFSYEVVRG